MSSDITQELLNRLSDVKRMCPDMRFGQMLATIGELAVDEVDRTLWEVEDEELAQAIDRFRHDLDRRVSQVA